ncbi:MAG TPA: peptidylprolyl isomerase [Anaeromyxobacteraceae bacterium]|nr:peptidylprolyl isomerase [Anaeromyxobacteraceae bacterium]
MTLLPALLALAALASPASDRRVVGRVAATVNGEVVTLLDVIERAGDAYASARELPAGAARDRATAEALRRSLDAIVSDKLLESAARQMEIEVTEEQIDAAVADIKHRNGFDDAQLDMALAQQGLDRKQFREQMRKEIRALSVMQYKVRNKIRVSDEDVRAYYQSHPGEFAGAEEVRIRHIFLPLPPGASEAEAARVRGEAERALSRIRAGEKFEAVAREVSKGPSADEGGDLGWIRRGTIEKALEDAAFRLKEGEVSAVLRAGSGLHVLQAADRRMGGGRSFDAAKDEIRERLSMEQFASFRDQYVAELRRGAAIQIRMAELDAAASK